MIEIIPAIDIIEGRCVRLSEGDYERKTSYDAQPLDMAKAYEQAGVRRLHLVDLDGAKAAGPQNLATLEQIATRTNLEIEFGGGIRAPMRCRRSSTTVRHTPSQVASQPASRSCSTSGWLLTARQK